MHTARTRILAPILLMLFVSQLQAQSVGININSPHPSAILHVASGDKGLLIPSMNSTQRAAIISPENGLLVYDVTTKSFWYFKESIWTEFSQGAFEKIGSLVRNAGSVNDDFIFGRSALPTNGASTTENFFFFDESKGAFRAGGLDNSANWSPDSLGDYSIGLGLNAKAGGDHSVALGREARSTASWTTAVGYQSEASRDFNSAIGALCEATGVQSSAMGILNHASGDGSFVFGGGSEATDLYSFVGGILSIASGEAAMALSFESQAAGDYSTTLGAYTRAQAYGSTAMGTYNYGVGNDSTWIPTEPILELGIGTSSNRHNAMTIMKNGMFLLGRDVVPGTAAITDSFLMYDKISSAFRGGSLQNKDYWKPAFLGISSFGYGKDVRPAGNYSAAFGESTTVDGTAIAAMAIGKNTLAEGNYSFAAGINSYASGQGSFALGNAAVALDSYSVAIGDQPQASNGSVAIGFKSNASGIYATAMGNQTISNSYANTAVGRFNVGFGTFNSIVAEDPILEIGIGTSIVNRRNAMTVLNNGDFIFGPHALPKNGVHSNENMFFYDESKAAVRFGLSQTHKWAPDSIGLISFATGNGSLAYGYTSAALGNFSRAFGGNSMAGGHHAHALGTTTVSFGNRTRARAFFSVALGSYNEGLGSTGSWIGTDPILEVGIGQSEGARENAMTILKNGNVGIGLTNPDSPLQIFGNSTTTIAQLKITESFANDGARIIFDNSIETDNSWTLYGRADDTDANSDFNIYYNNVGNIITATGLGNVGIKGNPNTDFHLFHANNASTAGLKIENSSNGDWLRWYVSSTSSNLRLYSKVQGATTIGEFDNVTGAYSSLSDRRVKEEFRALRFEWSDFMQLEPLTYQFIADKENTSHIGMIAQDVRLTYPELVKYNDEEDLFHMDYAGFGVLAIKAVQELRTELDAKDALISGLSETVQAQQKEIQSLQEQSREIQALREVVAELRTIVAEKL